MKNTPLIISVCIVILFTLICVVTLNIQIGGAIRLNPSEQRPPVPTIDINTADAEKLMMLPGIGESIANNIITYRQINGPFCDMNEVLLVDGIGPDLFSRIQQYISVGGSQ